MQVYTCKYNITTLPNPTHRFRRTEHMLVQSDLNIKYDGVRLLPCWRTAPHRKLSQWNLYHWNANAALGTVQCGHFIFATARTSAFREVRCANMATTSAWLQLLLRVKLVIHIGYWVCLLKKCAKSFIYSWCVRVSTQIYCPCYFLVFS